MRKSLFHLFYGIRNGDGDEHSKAGGDHRLGTAYLLAAWVNLPLGYHAQLELSLCSVEKKGLAPRINH